MTQHIVIIWMATAVATFSGLIDAGAARFVQGLFAKVAKPCSRQTTKKPMHACRMIRHRSCAESAFKPAA
jgi:hypothetical protein